MNLSVATYWWEYTLCATIRRPCSVKSTRISAPVRLTAKVAERPTSREKAQDGPGRSGSGNVLNSLTSAATRLAKALNTCAGAFTQLTAMGGDDTPPLPKCALTAQDIAGA